MSKCKGCGVTLQTENEKQKGYITDIKNAYCQRCFNLKHYNKDILNLKVISNDDILFKINKKNYFTMFLCDFLNLNKNMIDLYNQIKTKKIFIVTKMDIIPNNMELSFLEQSIKDSYKINNLLFFSIKNPFNKNKLLNIIDDNKNIVISGPTSSGKSSLINYLFKQELTISSYKNTTQDFITLKIDDLTIIDAPGFNFDFYTDNQKLKGKIKPITMSLKKDFVLSINEYDFYPERDINITLFFPSDVIIKTKKKKEDFNNNMQIKTSSDLLISNIGFIYFKTKVNIFINSVNNIETRKSVVGK